MSIHTNIEYNKRQYYVWYSFNNVLQIGRCYTTINDVKDSAMLLCIYNSHER